MRYVLIVILGTAMFLASSALAAQVCPECQAEWPDDDNYCTACGAELLVNCPNCGTLFRKADQTICHNCGYNVETGRVGAGPKVIYENDFDVWDLKGLKVCGSGIYNITEEGLIVGSYDGEGEEMTCGLFGGDLDLKNYKVEINFRVVQGWGKGGSAVCFYVFANPAQSICIHNDLQVSRAVSEHFGRKAAVVYGNVYENAFYHGLPKPNRINILGDWTMPHNSYRNHNLVITADSANRVLMVALDDASKRIPMAPDALESFSGQFGLATFDDEVIAVDYIKVTALE